MVRNGLSIMDEDSYMQYFGRGIVQLLDGLRRQAPASLDVRVDADAILEAISYQPPDMAGRRALPPWPLAPSDPSHKVSPEVEGLDSGRELRGREGRKRVSDTWWEAHKNVLPFFPEMGGRSLQADMQVAPWNTEDDPNDPPPLIDDDLDEEFEELEENAGAPARARQTGESW